MNKTIKVRVMAVDRPHHEKGMIFPRKVVEKALEKVQIAIRNRRFFVGSKSESWAMNSSIDLLDVIGIVTDMKIEGEYVVAKIQFLDTPAYKKFSSALKRFPHLNMNDMFTSVGVGSVKKSNVNGEPSTVKDDYEFIGLTASSLRTDYGGLEGRFSDDEICV